MQFVVMDQDEQDWLRAYYPGVDAEIGHVFDTSRYVSIAFPEGYCPPRLRSMQRYDLNTDRMVWNEAQSRSVWGIIPPPLPPAFPSVLRGMQGAPWAVRDDISAAFTPGQEWYQQRPYQNAVQGQADISNQGQALQNQSIDVHVEVQQAALAAIDREFWTRMREAPPRHARRAPHRATISPLPLP